MRATAKPPPSCQASPGSREYCTPSMPPIVRTLLRPFVFVFRVLLERGHVAHDLIEVADGKALGSSRGGALTVGVERDRGAGARGQLARKAIVDDARADDRAGRQRAHVVFDGTRHDAIDAIQDQRVVADVAAQGIGHHGVAAELEITESAGLLVAQVGDDATGLIDGEHGVELLVLRDRSVHLLQRASSFSRASSGTLASESLDFCRYLAMSGSTPN